MEDEILTWAENQSGPGKRFRDISHTVEFALYRLREQLKKEG